MLRRLRRILFLVMALGLAGCANTVYRYNIEHAEISENANLSQAEVDQIIATVTKKSLRLIIGVTRLPEEGRDRVIVYTAEAPEEGGMMVYRLEKGSDGTWQIVTYGRENVMVM
jgi:hypothetical protein